MAHRSSSIYRWLSENVKSIVRANGSMIYDTDDGRKSANLVAQVSEYIKAEHRMVCYIFYIVHVHVQKK